MFEPFDGGMILLVLLIPGFIIYNAMNHYLTRERPTDIRLLLYYLVYSGIYLIGTSFLLPSFLQTWLKFGLYALIFPLVLGSLIGYAANSKTWSDIKRFRLKINKEPYPTAWDAFFNRRINEIGACHVIITLQDGNKIMGLLAGDSAASEYPMSHDIYLEEVYLDASCTPKTDSAGVWVPKEEIRYIEFYRIGGDNNEQTTTEAAT